VDEMYEINKYFENKPKNSSQLSSEAELASDMHSTAQDLVNYYVRVEGLSISQVNYKKYYIFSKHLFNNYLKVIYFLFNIYYLDAKKVC
jgi:hypothetical protein